jgi:hypothetical protein
LPTRLETRPHPDMSASWCIERPQAEVAGAAQETIAGADEQVQGFVGSRAGLPATERECFLGFGLDNAVGTSHCRAVHLENEI